MRKFIMKISMLILTVIYTGAFLTQAMASAQRQSAAQDTEPRKGRSSISGSG